MKKIIIVMLLSFAIVLCGCEKNKPTVSDSTYTTTTTENNKDTVISEPFETQPTNIAIVRLKSTDDYKSFLDKEKREIFFQNHEIPLSDSDIERLREISDSLANETLYTVSNSKENLRCQIQDCSYARTYDYDIFYGNESFHVAFQIPYNKKNRTTLIEEGILAFLMRINKTIIETKDGFTNSDGDVYIPTKITIEDQELDALYVLNSNGTTSFYFELSGQVALVYLTNPTNFEEDLKFAESLGICKLKLD